LEHFLVHYAIISDLHANVEALEAVLAHAGDIPMLCLGDIIGYGPQPNEVVEMVRARAVHTVVGNHDLAGAAGIGVEDFNPRAAASAQWTNRQLTQANIDWILSLPYTVSKPTFNLVHGSPNTPADFNYLVTPISRVNAFKACTDRITFVGHSHFPDVSEQRPDGRIWNSPIEGDGMFTFHPAARYMVNVGSTGQPRDRDTRASYVVFDDEALTATWHRVAYDVAAVQAKIRATGLPVDCADRLSEGR
jgi:diadenosine tetraphosphatase ApaH/serine/threonine PP2A family protein phosphatase